MTFKERNVLTSFSTNYYFWVIFLTKDILNSLCTTSLDLYLDIILVSAKNAVSYKYVVAKGSSILIAF